MKNITNKYPVIYDRDDHKIVKKGWGEEVHFANNDHYCGKLLCFDEGKKFSMHYHVDKYETWMVALGSFKFHWIDPQTSETKTEPLTQGQSVTIYQGIAHQLEALEDSIIFEVSTPDDPNDSYRVIPGDSQK